MTTRPETARQLPKTAPRSDSASEVRSMQRGMRWLALRGTSARPATLRPATRERRRCAAHFGLDDRATERAALIGAAGMPLGSAVGPSAKPASRAPVAVGGRISRPQRARGRSAVGRSRLVRTVVSPAGPTLLLSGVLACSPAPVPPSEAG